MYQELSYHTRGPGIPHLRQCNSSGPIVHNCLLLSNGVRIKLPVGRSKRLAICIQSFGLPSGLQHSPHSFLKLHCLLSQVRLPGAFIESQKLKEPAVTIFSHNLQRLSRIVQHSARHATPTFHQARLSPSQHMTIVHLSQPPLW